mmetsp:Transcript_23235/g.36975  ORF Transcript_23235/g.36975 Transcript_23235/m.36975 type:complete len:235 (-) Transcript_23235:4617-5321(-)
MDSGLISHVFQEGDWDCGLACVRMVLRAVFPGVETRATSSRALTKIVQTRNIWTTHFNVPFVYYTTMRNEIDKSLYTGMPFYSDIGVADEKRVNAYFKEVPKRGFEIVRRSLTNQEFRKTLLGDIPLNVNNVVNNNHGIRGAIVLVDIHMLYPRSQLDADFFFRTVPRTSNAYIGHFVVVTGYDEAKGMYAYLDPVGPQHTQYVCESVFEKARKAPGTDEDVIFIRIQAQKSTF